MINIILSVDEELTLLQKSNVKLRLINSEIIFENINQNDIEPDYLSWVRSILFAFIHFSIK